MQILESILEFQASISWICWFFQKAENGRFPVTPEMWWISLHPAVRLWIQHDSTITHPSPRQALNCLGDFLFCCWPLQTGVSGAAAATALSTMAGFATWLHSEFINFIEHKKVRILFPHLLHFPCVELVRLGLVFYLVLLYTCHSPIS